MPPYPGEDRLVTVFADIHYYFAPPTIRPVLHRFDKASYFYIYYNSTRHTSRIEIANHPGTPDQDAFHGYIDTCHISNSYRFPTLLTIEVDGANPKSPSSPVSGRDAEEWCLTSNDPRDANRAKYRIHTLDIYFWAQDDAKQVVACFKKLLPRDQLEIAELDEEPYEERSQQKPASAMSPVVQNLENMAVQDPAYNGSDHDRQTSTVSPSASFASHNIPGPPAGGFRGGQQVHSPSPAISDLSSVPGRQASVQSKENTKSQDYTPIAYNPAAPAAPEPIAHREKTPPPEDGVGGTGLKNAALHDQVYSPGLQQRQPQQGGYQIGQGPPVQYGFGSPPPPPSSQPSRGYTSPPANVAQQTAAYNASPPTSSTAGYNSPHPSSLTQVQSNPRSSLTSQTSAAPSFGPSAVNTLIQHQQPPLGQIIGAPPSQSLVPSEQHRQSQAAEQYTPQNNHNSGTPALTPGSQFYSTIPQPTKPLSHVQPQYADYLSSGSTPVQQSFPPVPTQAPQPPIGGYSSYDYRTGSGQGQQSQQGSEYDIHSQVYRPTEAEAHGHRKPSRPGDKKKESVSERAERGVGKLFKRIEKKIG